MKRILSFLCMLAMLLSVVNPAAFAAEETAGAETIVLEADASNVTVNRDTIIDLNGHNLDGVTVTGGTLYCMDSQTADYTVADGVYGHLTNVTGNVEAAEGYLQVGDSFHAVNLDIYAMTLRAADVGVYYKSNFAADEIVAAEVESFGVALSIVTAPTAANLDSYCGYSVFTGFEAGEGANATGTSTLLKGIMKAANGDNKNAKNAAMPIYGSAYIKTAEGYIFGETVKRSLQEQVEAIDKVWSSLKDSQKTPVLGLLESYTAVMENWDIPNIRGIQVPGADEEIQIPVNVTADNGAVTEAVTVEQDGVSVTVPAGTKLAEGAEKLTLTISPKETSDAGLTLEESEVLMPMDVHVEGLAADNAQPITIYMGKVMPENLNMGNYAVYHVENGKANEMTLIPVDAEFTAHNQYKYSLDGELTLYMASFSEVAVVASEAKWEGKRDYTWYNTTDTTLYIRNADQLAAFGAIVGGMAKTADNVAIEQDSFAGKTVVLWADISIGDLTDEDGRTVMFYPIGYYNTTGSYVKQAQVEVTSGFKNFSGIFDGNGHTVSDFYQNTWEAFGDYNDGYAGKPNHYRDGFGLFGRVYGGTVKNLTVKNFSSDGEFTTTGTIAAYAEGATFENIAIFNCNPRVYNIGNGGIVGCVGWYAKEADLKTTFTNITVDNTNKITALWGSWDVACGGIVGQYYPTSGQTSAGQPKNGGVHFENCHVAAQIDVYNDVCANYQYYAYRYAGILMGSVRENETINGHVYPKMDGITASGCTVHFGDWNDYYYCELVANTLASYTHDHQMSRLVQVKSVDVENMKIVTLKGEEQAIPDSGRYNYVVVKAQDANGMWIHGDGADYATCYHFVDGAVWNHADAGTEEVDTDGDGVKETVLKEDKQIIYREFNNLVTGYGWGVTTKAVGEMEGVEILDRKEGYSVEKFEVSDTISEAYRANNERNVGKLFKAATIADPDLQIKDNKVRVTVSPDLDADPDSTAGCVYTPHETDWTRGTLLFTGKGKALVTITDYYFCIATTVKVEIVENNVTGISVKTNKNLYDISKNETFAAGDITVTAVYSDGVARTLDVSDYTYAFKENAGDFTTFGEKTGVVTYTYAEETVTAEFKVVAVNMQELTLAGVPESGVEGEVRIQRYFEQFGINAVGQKYYTMPGVASENADASQYGNEAAWDFATGTVKYTVNSHAGLACFDETDKNGQLTIDCSTAPFTDIFGYVGYADRVPVAFGVYVDTVDNLTYTLPMANNADIVKFTGTENSRIFYIQAPLNNMNLAAGEHKVHFISIFEDGVQPLTTWTVNVGQTEDEVIADKTANVIILAGQSNAYGASALTDAVKAQAVEADYSNIFINYSNINCENGVWKSLYYNAGFEQFYPGLGGTVNGACFGPEVGIAYELATNANTKNQVWYIIKYTAAGSMLDGQWLEGTYDNEGLVQDMGGHLSDLMLSYVDDSLAKIQQIHGDNINVHSFVWMQGESDALATDCAGKYQANEAALVNKVRSHLAQYAEAGNGNNIAFVSGAIAKLADIEIKLTGKTASNGWTYSDTVNNGKKENAKVEWNPVTNDIQNNAGVLSNSAFIDTASLLVGANAGENNDVYHYSSDSMWNLGKWFGQAANYLDSTDSSGSDSGETTQYTVTYEANGGTCGTASATVNAGDTVTLPTPDARTGYTFQWWSDGTTTYAAGASYTVNSDVTLTAQWEQIQYTITVENNASNVTYTISHEKAEVEAEINLKLTYKKSWFLASSTKDVTVKIGNVSETITLTDGQESSKTFSMPAENITITIS